MNTNYFFDYSHLRGYKYKFQREKYGRGYKREEQNIIAFDIETSNGYRDENGDVHAFDWEIAHNHPDFYSKLEPVSLMWMWQCAVENMDTEDIDVYLGRTWDDFKLFLLELNNTMQIILAGYDPKIKEPMRTQLLSTIDRKEVVLRIYIHNLGFEFQHLRNAFKQELSEGTADIFARQMRKPMRVNFEWGDFKIILNDTLCLTQKSLKNWGKDANLPIKKIEEPKDFYMPIRTPLTKLNVEEIGYGVNDVATMVCGMRIYRDKYSTLRNIPMTQTGEVRRKCENTIALANQAWSENCARITENMSFELYKELNAAFVGGWTHANSIWAGKLLENLNMFDFRSSYPAVMVSRTYPISEFVETTESDIVLIAKRPINSRIEHYYVIVEFDDVQTKTFNTFWSSSKTTDLEGAILDNGKIYACDHMQAVMTDLDYERFCEVYSYSSKTIHKAMKAKAGYLPKEFIETILSYYGYKTSLKGIEEEESLYGESKQFINSIYGVCVTKIITDMISYLEDWKKAPATVEDYNNAIEQQLNKNSFTCYQIGVWVTAWARHNLWDAIKHLDRKTVYCDTDSIKGFFDEKDLKWFDDYNQSVWQLCENVATHYGIDIETYRPQTQKGKVKEIGFFDDEGVATKFKTYGAKRYVYEQDGEVICTIAGISKNNARDKIGTVENFSPDIEWDVQESGKLTCHYNDMQPRTVWRDRDGNVYESWDRYGINLEPASFSLGLAEEYAYLLELLDGSELDDYYDIPAIMRNKG